MPIIEVEAIPVAMGVAPLEEPYGLAPYRSNHDAVESRDRLLIRVETDDGVVPSAVEPAGVNLDALSAHLDGVTAICHTDSPETARERVREGRAAFDGPVQAAVTLDPDVVPNEAAFREVVLAAREAATGDLAVYNYSLMGDEQVAWLTGVT